MKDLALTEEEIDVAARACFKHGFDPNIFARFKKLLLRYANEITRLRNEVDRLYAADSPD